MNKISFRNTGSRTAYLDNLTSQKRDEKSIRVWVRIFI